MGNCVYWQGFFCQQLESILQLAYGFQISYKSNGQRAQKKDLLIKPVFCQHNMQMKDSLHFHKEVLELPILKNSLLLTVASLALFSGLLFQLESYSQAFLVMAELSSSFSLLWANDERLGMLLN